MPDANMEDFYRRMDRINRHHRKLSRGHKIVVGKDGLIEAQPRTLSGSIPWRGILFALIVVMGAKGWMHSSIGAAAYDARVATMATGSAMSKTGAFILTADPVTLWVSGAINSLTK